MVVSNAYGSLSGYGSVLSTTHAVILSGLSPVTTYHFDALSRDATGALAVLEI